MDLIKINKFIQFIKSRPSQYIYYSNIFKLKSKSEPINNIFFKPNKNEYTIELGKDIIIIYNIITTKISCIFYSEPEYIQSEYLLFNPIKFLTPYVKYMVSQCINPTNCLIIGLCLGNMPNALVGRYESAINRIDCVDINALLCKFYKKFLSISKITHVYCSTGMNFLKTIPTSKSYSYVAIDIPCKFISNKFMDLIHNITSKYTDRIIVLNLIGNDCEKLDLSQVFSKFKIISYKKILFNKIFVIS